MKIVVLVKYVPEATAAWRYAEDFTLDRANVEGRLSELDEYAVEQAIALVEKGLPATITYLTMGPARAVDGLRKALAMGGDEAVHVQDELAARVGRPHDVAGAGQGDRAHRLRPRAVRDGLYRRRHVSRTGDGRRAPRCPAAHLRREPRGGRRFRDRPARGRRRDADGGGHPAGRRVGHRPDRRGALPVVQGDHGRQEEARRDLVAGRPRRRPRRRWARPRPRPLCVARPGAPARQAGTVIVDKGEGAAALADFLVAQKLL